MNSDLVDDNQTIEKPLDANKTETTTQPIDEVTPTHTATKSPKKHSIIKMLGDFEWEVKWVVIILALTCGLGIIICNICICYCTCGKKKKVYRKGVAVVEKATVQTKKRRVTKKSKLEETKVDISQQVV